MSLYPQLEPKADNFRLNKIGEIQKVIQAESEKRRTLYKKYRRAINIVDGFSMALNAVSLATSIAGVSILAIIPPECVAIGCQVLTIVGSLVNRRLSAKTKKHEDIKTLADAKLNTIATHISKALQDNNISDNEFNLVVNELDKYNALKHEIRSHSMKKHPEIDQKNY